MRGYAGAEQDFYATFNVLPVPIAIHDDAGDIKFFNRAFEETFGYSVADIPTLEVWWSTAYPDPAYRDKLAALWTGYTEEAKRSGQLFTPMSAEVRCKDGSVRTISCSAAPMGEGPVIRHLAVLYDITEKKHIEDELRRTRVSVEAVSDAIYWVSPEARIIDVNAACGMLGYTREELLQMTVLDISPRFNFEKWQQHFLEVRQNGTKTLESEHRTKDGRLIPMEVVANYVRFGETELICGICRDISEHKRTIADLEEYGKLFKYTSDMVVVVGENGLCKKINPAFAKTLGYTEGELVGKPLLELIHPDDHERTNSELQRQINVHVDTFNFENRYLCKDGSVRWFSWNAYYEADEQVFYGIARDVTERKKIEDALKKSEERYRAIVESHTEFVNRFLPGGILTYANEALLKWHGIKDEGDVIGRSIYPFIHEDDRDEVRRQIESLSRENPVVTLEERVVTREGKECWLQWTNRALFDEAGRVVEYQSVGRDITEKKLADELLAMAKQAAEAASQAKSDFLANMSHEIRTPITGVLGFAELLAETDLSEQQHRYVQTISSSADTLLVLVNDILDLSKIEAGKFDLEHIEFSLREVVSEVVGSQGPLALAKSLAVKTAIEAEAPDRLAGDPLRLKQILLNLVVNAIKFTEQGEVSLSVTAEERHDSTVLLRFDVADTGIGIKPEDTSRIFKPFSQADASSTRKYGGTGLGLAICAKLSALMGGEIWVDSRAGLGSTFHVRLPFAVSDAWSGANPAHRQNQPFLWEGAPLRVLLVEDYEISQRFFAEVLKRHGHHVEIAPNGVEALAKLRHGRYDMVLMDVQMPVMDGVEAVAKIREMEAKTGTHLPVIALTAYAMEEDRLDILSKGFDGYVSKPMKIKELVGEMKRCLGK